MALSFESQGRKTNRPRLLVVEDDLTVVFALRHFFAVAGYEVDCAAGPAEAGRLLDHYGYDAVITDLHLLPGVQGEGLRVAAHARRRNPKACILMVTATAMPGMEEAARRSGVDVYRVKPVDLSELTACFAHVLGVAAPRGSVDRPSSGDGEA